MSHITDIWSARSTQNSTHIILPDGCRDLIIKQPDQHESSWFVSHLYEHSEKIKSQAQTSMIGFRFKPGMRIKHEKLSKYMQTGEWDISDSAEISNLEDMLNDVTYLNNATEDALSCLASDLTSITQAASHLGVSTRSLQRLLQQETGKSPSCWFQLARARKAAKRLTQAYSLVEVADIYGFSDQSHMCREFQRWFKTSPTLLLANANLTDQLAATGYGFD